MSDLLADLNAAQREAVAAPEGPALVVAGAGSGKTRVLTTRIAWLLRQGVRPGEILAFTFTNKAAREMRERVDRQVGEGRAPFWIGTFHATGLKILRRDGAALGLDPDFVIYDVDDQKRLLKRVLADENVDAKQFPPNGLRAVISAWKNDDTAPEAAAEAAGSYVEEVHARLYRAYELALARCHALDFDDLILKTVHLLEQDPTVRERYAGRFRHVLVDEFQDTNQLQLLLVKLLASVHGNVFAVGDDDQSIYGWRGARVENMLDFDEVFPGARTYRLEQNYRSVGNILAAANAVIAHNRRRKGKSLWTEAAAGDPLRVEEHLDAEDEAHRVVEIVQEELARGLKRGDITVMYRTNAQSRLLEDALRRARLPHQVVGSLQFYERKEVRDLLAYLKLVANPADQIALQRIINVPKRRIGDTTVARLLAVADLEELTPGEAAARPGLLEGSLGGAACQRLRAFFGQVTGWRMAAGDGRLSVPELLERIVADTGFEDFLQVDDPQSAAGRRENVAELINAAHAFQEAVPGGTLAQYLEQTALISDPDTIPDGEGAVRLMTVHTAKGLEFPVVILTGCEDDLLPHASARDTDAGAEEERRLFYVALTRAQRRIHLLHATRRRRFGSYEDALPSRFLDELPDEICQRQRVERTWARPVARSLFGEAGASRARSTPPPPRRPSPHGPAVRPEDWGRRGRPVPRPTAPAGGGAAWDGDVPQSTPFYTGQLVAHATFGAGVVERVEGKGDDLVVTVDFRESGRKHVMPRFATLTPLD